MSKHETIIRHAATLFDDAGYHTTTMDGIAGSVGLAKATLYHYFRSKDEILSAIHETFIGMLLEQHKKRCRAASSAEDLLHGIAVDILSLMQTHRGYVRVFFEHHRELSIARQRTMRRKRDRYFTAVRSLLEDGVEDGRFDVNPTVAAMALFGMCNWAYHWFDTDGALTTDEIARAFYDILMHGIRRQS